MTVIQGLAVKKDTVANGYLNRYCVIVSLYIVVWRDCFLMNSQIQLKWVQEGWACPTSRYSPQKYVEIERMHVLHHL